MGELWLKMMHVFWSQSPGANNMRTTGVRLSCSAGDKHYFFRGKFAGVLADELAIRDVFACKGASALRPCLSCCVVGRCDSASVHEGLTHFSNPDLSRCHTCSPAEYHVMADKLTRAKADGMGVERFDALERRLGLKYLPRTLLFDTVMRLEAPMPASLIWDWQHVFCSSGGVAQIELNQYVLKICTMGEQKISLSQLDDWCSQVSMGSSMTKLTKTYFNDRVGQRFFVSVIRI